MSKSDQSKHRICIAAIKRHTILPNKFQWTRFYETPEAHVSADLPADHPLAPEECMICSVMIDEHNYSVLTTRKLITRENGNISIAEIEGASDCLLRNFKNIHSGKYSMGSIRGADGKEVKYLIETGPASMIMIYGIQTLLSIL
jgi:hypothetical protein